MKYPTHYKRTVMGLVPASSVEYASHSTCNDSPEAYSAFYESDETNRKMAQDKYASSEEI
jgi:hypothetical protein